MLLAAAVRALRWHLTAVMFNDGPRFLGMAQAFAAGDVSGALAGPDHPLYPALVAPLLAAGIPVETAGVAVSVAAGALAVAAMFALADAVVGRAAAWCAAALLATHGIAIEFTGDIQSEGVYLALWLAAAALAARGLASPRARTLFAAGACSGLAYLARPEGLLLSGVAAVLLGAGALRGTLAPSRAARLALALALGAGLVAAPYLVWLRVHDGEWSLTRKKSVATLVGVEAPAQRPAGGAHGPRREREPLGVRAAATGGALTRTLVRSLRPEGVALLLAGAVAAWPLRRRREDLWPLALIAAYALLLFALGTSQGYVSTRHALPLAIVALSWVGAAAVAIGRRFGPRRALLATALCVAVAGSLGLGKALRPDRMHERAERALAEWLRESGAPVTGVATAKERIAWYAGAPHVPVHPGMLPGSLRRRGASHVILTDSHLARTAFRRPLETQYREVRTLEIGGVRAHLWEALPRDAETPKARPRQK